MESLWTTATSRIFLSILYHLWVISFTHTALCRPNRLVPWLMIDTVAEAVSLRREGLRLKLCVHGRYTWSNSLNPSMLPSRTAARSCLLKLTHWLLMLQDPFSPLIAESIREEASSWFSCISVVDWPPPTADVRLRSTANMSLSRRTAITANTTSEVRRTTRQRSFYQLISVLRLRSCQWKKQTK